MEDTIAGFKAHESQPIDTKIDTDGQATSQEDGIPPTKRELSMDLEPISTSFSADLDVPAFLRRSK